MFNMMKILVVDNNIADLAMISEPLKHLYNVYPVDSGKTALKFLQKQQPDLILLDLDMPEMSGIDFIKIIKSIPEFSGIPVIFLIDSKDKENEWRVFELGAVDCLHKPVNNMVMMAKVKMHLELESYRKEVGRIVDLKTSRIMQLQNIIIELFSCANEYCYKDAGDHIKRVVGYVCAIMNNLPKYAPESYHITKSYYDDIKRSVPLHDIGEMSISDSILLKPGSLTNEEYEIVKNHVIIGAELLKKAIKEFGGHSFLDVTLEIVMTHHERWDGTGYPNKLKEKEIPLSGRIVAIADVYDALISERPYKAAFSYDKALEIITNNSGKHFDPVLVKVFVNIHDNIQKIAEKYRGN